MHVVIFEGSRWPTFAPLSLSRPVFTLASGMSTLLDKQLRYTQPTRLTLWVRPELVGYCRKYVLPSISVPVEINAPLNDEPALLISGRTLHLGTFEIPHEPCVVVDEEGVCFAWVDSPGLAPRDVMERTDKWLALQELPRTMPQGRLATYLWDLITWNDESLVDDAIRLKCIHDKPRPKLAGPYHLVHDEDVCVSESATLGPGCVLDASKGPIVVDDHASVGANAVLQGPCYVGPHSQVTPLSLIRPGTTIGPMCKVGGEVGNSIFLGYSNKGHEGYVGDSYVGEWVNFGAGSTTSNLKNTYGEIDITVGSRTLPTGKRFLGSLIGDHTKLAIGTRLMTGSYVGYCCMVATGALPPRTIPSFTFLTDKGPAPYDRAKAKEVMTAVYARRQREWSTADDELLQYAFAAAGEVER